ncbi:MAG: aminotransferase class I/II-fold pyridoxal phosphate-dependent enzyme [Armatimonadota bacterium]|nr:aminotransferase class I/II-fold pyridoxal phosphate-dependent enzyme [bacterium]MCS7309996.1 aminotransferase class I/II-fold pyridoxal phosphate-dependent enzyme [Armatimonadota bacterium]MDW8289361.1 aminotransferase class I/II-fold pyridoxal phosphate-dependent enzyme [Armatimonadota bacterium]
MKPLSQAVASVPPSGIRRFFDVAAQLEDCISLGVGEPDFVTPWHIREAAIWAIEKGFTTYTSNYGLFTLRQRIAAHLKARYGVEYSPESEVLVTVGVSEGLDIALRALVNPGDEVILFEPSYVSYVPCVLFAGGTPVCLPTDYRNGFQPDVERLRRALTHRTKAILLCYPNNPTGAVATRETLEEIVRLAVEHDVYLVSDEIYDRLVYETEHTCVAALPGAAERTILLGGFSKSYAMTGWRIGYACAPAPLLEMMMKVHQYTMLCAPIVAQKAAEEALERGETEVERMRREYDRRRRLVVERLNDMGLECVPPQGAFYVFPSIRCTGLSSEEFTERLLWEERVAVVPGNVFGASGEGHVRLSYATSLPKIEEALRRIERFVLRHRG